MRRVILFLAMLGALAIPTTANAIGVTTRWVDDDGRADSPNGCAGSSAAFTQIQPAVDASGPGDRVLVCPGTYTGHVLLGPEDDHITLRAATAQRPVIRAPRELQPLGDPSESTFRGVVDIEGARGIRIRGFAFRPHGGTDSCTAVQAMIALRDGSATIVDNRFRPVAPNDTACRWYLYGVSAQTSADGRSARIVVRENVFRDPVRDGVVAFSRGDVHGLTYTVERNRFLWRTDLPEGGGLMFAHGDGVVADNVFLADEGVFPPRGAVTLQGRSTVVGNVIRNAGGFFVGAAEVTLRHNVVTEATGGILLFDSGGLIADNVLLGLRRTDPASGDTGIEARTFDGANFPLELHGNIVSDFHVGVFIHPWFAGASIHDNDFRGNVDTDCVDVTQGEGTAGTANSWIRNLGIDSFPPGICRRTS
jgi:hypothetical protein